MDDRQRKQAGWSGENTALQYLCAQGLELVARNYRCKAGEIDLVMLEHAAPARTTLALIEVRYRADVDFGGAAASVCWRKQQRIIKAARYLLLRRPDLRQYPARFDVIALSPATNARGWTDTLTPGTLTPNTLTLEWLRHAFTL